MHASSRMGPARCGQISLALFFLVIFGPALAGLFRVPTPADFREMRPLAAWPGWDALVSAGGPARFEAWLNDHFPLRQELIVANGFVKYRLLGAPGNDVIVGRHGWLFYSGDSTVADLLGRDRLSDDDLKRWAEALELRRDWLRAQGVAYLFVIAPNKSTIYPEELPGLLRSQLKPGKLDQLLSYLKARSNVPVLDLRPALFAEKARRADYLKTDSHWNGYGHVAATRAILERLHEMGVATRSIDGAEALQMDVQETAGDLVDLLSMRGHWPLSPEPLLRLRRPDDLRDVRSGFTALPLWKDYSKWQRPVITEDDSGSGSGALLSDSFFRIGGLAREATAQTPFILAFHRFLSVWCHPDYPIISAVVAWQHPDVIIEQHSERLLKTDVPGPSPEFAGAVLSPRP